MLKYKIKYIEYNGKIDDLIFDFGDNKEVLSMFLSSDVTPFADWIKEAIDEVLLGKIDAKTINGNACTAEIHPDTTKIYDMFIEDDDEYYATCCEVETKELRLLIDEWCEAIRKFKEEKGN